ncbi:MAG: hypothetical protein KBB83_01445 [Alphaproteobacteria bacterium]|nr:hypothetical protein [Alphaproteobacteria bacterium]
MTFYFVTPENRSEYRGLMQDFFSRLSLIWGEVALDKYDTQNARYLVCSHHEFGVIGGMRLLPTLGPKLSDESLSESGVMLHDDMTWEGTKLFFYLPFDHPIQDETEAYEELCYYFYQGLWEYIQEVLPIEMIVTLIPECEHLDALHFGKWPFMLESNVKSPFQDDEEYTLGVLRIENAKEMAIAS